MNNVQTKIGEIVKDTLDLFYNTDDFNNLLSHNIKIFTVFVSLPMRDRTPNDIFNDILKMTASNEFLEHIKFFERADDGEIVAIKFVANNIWNDCKHSEIMLGIHPDHKDRIFYREDMKSTTLDGLKKNKRCSTDYLGEAIKSLGRCEYVLFHPDYSNANGCLVEEFVADKYNKIPFYIQNLDDTNRLITDRIVSELGISL